MIVSSLWRYPVKGLGGESLSAAAADEKGFACDRRWLLATCDIAPLMSGAAKWRPWNYGLTLKKTERLAMLRAAVCGDTLTVCADGDSSSGASGDINSPAALREVEKFLRNFLEDDSIVLADCARRPVWDEEVPLTALFSESVAALSQQMGAPLEAERFRANIVLDGGAAWEERSMRGDFLCGKNIRMKVGDNVQRCAATRVNPQTAKRDLNVPEALMRFFGHNEMGVECAAAGGGEIKVGENFYVEKSAGRGA